MRKISALFSAAAGLFMAAVVSAPAQAATYDVVKDLTPAYVSEYGIRRNTSTYSTDFVGALITANYTDGTSETITWQYNNPWNIWHADARGENLNVSFVNFGFALVSNVRRLSSVALDLAPANAIFDADYLPEGAELNTPTTKRGSPFHATYSMLGADDHVSVSYSGLMQLAGFAPGVDAFTRLAIDFSQTAGGGLLGTFAFGGDTDVLAVPGDLTAVPLPKGILLMLAALGAFGALRLRGRSEGSIAAA